MLQAISGIPVFVNIPLVEILVLDRSLFERRGNKKTMLLAA